MSSPTSRSLDLLRKQGYLADVVERWIPGANIRKDLFGFIDIVAIKDGEIRGIQATTGSNCSSRVKKIAAHDNVAAVRKAGFGIFVHAWSKNSAGRWNVRIVDCS